MGVAAISLAAMVAGVLEVVIGDDADLINPALLALATFGSVRATRVPATRPGVAFIAVFIGLLWVGYVVLLMWLGGFRVPLLLQDAAIVWPQLIFFGPTLWSVEPNGGPAFPHALAGFATVVFWAVIGGLFVASVRRLTSLPVLLGLAVIVVIGAYAAVRAAVPVMNWRFLLEFP